MPTIWQVLCQVLKTYEVPAFRDLYIQMRRDSSMNIYQIYRMVMSAIEKTRAELGRKASCYWVGVNVLYRMVSNKVTFEQIPEGTEGQAIDITKEKYSSQKKWQMVRSWGGNISGVFEGSKEASVLEMKWASREIIEDEVREILGSQIMRAL